MTHRDIIQKMAAEKNGVLRTTHITVLGYTAYAIRKPLQRLELTSRMKDIYDIYCLSCMFDFDGLALQSAILETLKNRGTAYERGNFDRVIALAKSKDIQVRWRQYLRSLKMDDLSIEDVMNRIERFLGPVWNAHTSEGKVLSQWECQSAGWEINN